MHHTPTARPVVGLIGWLVLTFSAAAVGAWGSVSAGSFYNSLAQPSWAPPAWLFGPVWSVLYMMIGIAAWWVWRARGWQGARTALTLYVVQLAANALWTWLFFVWHLGAWAFAEIVLLWLLIVWTLLAFRRVRAAAAALLVPYLAWVSFACALSYAMWSLNPSVMG